MPGRLGRSIEKRISGIKPNAATYEVHGLVTKVYADEHLLALAIQDFLRHFRGRPDAAADIEFYLLTTEPGFEYEPGDQTGATELLYDWNVLRYVKEGQLRYQEVPDAGWVVADPEAGLAVAFVDQDMAACAWSIAHVIFFPLWAQMLKIRGIFPIHAAGLERHGRGIIFPGKSGCGKSTLSLHLLRHGYRLLGDDMVLVRSRGSGAQMLSFPEEVSAGPEKVGVNPRLSLALNPAAARWQPQTVVNLDEAGPGLVVESSFPELLVFPVIAADGRTRWERVGRAEALAELILYAFLFMDPETSRENFDLLAALVRTAECFRLHMGQDGAELAGAVDDIIAAA